MCMMDKCYTMVLSLLNICGNFMLREICGGEGRSVFVFVRPTVRTRAAASWIKTNAPMGESEAGMHEDGVEK